MNEELTKEFDRFVSVIKAYDVDKLSDNSVRFQITVACMNFAMAVGVDHLSPPKSVIITNKTADEVYELELMKKQANDFFVQCQRVGGLIKERFDNENVEF